LTYKADAKKLAEGLGKLQQPAAALKVIPQKSGQGSRNASTSKLGGVFRTASLKLTNKALQ